MLNRISQRLWPVEYWQNKKKQFMAGGLSGRRIWLASGLGGLAILFAVTVAAGILTARPYDQARHIPLRPIPEDQLLPSAVRQPDPSEAAAKPVVPRKTVTEHSRSIPESDGAAQPSVWPVNSSINYEFGWQQHPILKDWRFHTGVDLRTEAGKPVAAVLSGKVAEVRHDERLGLTVIISAGEWKAYHSSLSAATVKPGDQVSAGQSIGSAGESFQEPYPHVHLGIDKNGQFVNPAEVLPSR